MNCVRSFIDYFFLYTQYIRFIHPSQYLIILLLKFVLIAHNKVEVTSKACS
jgi:hypothetical protein